MSDVMDSRRLAEYRRRISDPGYLKHALVEVAGILTELLVAPERREFRASQNGHGSLGGTSHYN